jgi:hypothetical protein
VGLKADSTVVAVGANAGRQCDVSHWRDIVQIAAGSYHTVGLKADGTVVAAGLETELAKWNLGVIQKKPSINWLLIGGLIAAAVIAGAVILFVRRPKKKTA